MGTSITSFCKIGNTIGVHGDNGRHTDNTQMIWTASKTTGKTCGHSLLTGATSATMSEPT